MRHKLSFVKVASKQSEIGIGQTAFTESYFEQVDFLPPMTYQELIISQRKPNEIVSFTTLIYPLDNYVWGFTFLSAAVMLIALILVKKVDNHIKGRAISSGDNYQG